MPPVVSNTSESNLAPARAPLIFQFVSPVIESLNPASFLAHWYILMHSFTGILKQLTQSRSLIATLLCCALAAPLAAEERDPARKPFTVTESYRQLADSMEPLQAWQATNADEHQAWRKQFHPTVVRILGKMPERVPLEVKWAEEKEFDTFTRHKIYIRTEAAYWAPVYYFVPHKLKKKVPAIVCMHGHSGIIPYIDAGKTKAEKEKTRQSELDYAVYFAKHGYITAAIVMRGWNETAGDQDRGVSHTKRSCLQMTMNALLIGSSPQGQRSWDAMRVIDFLQTQDQVDPNRIAAAGLSGGGATAMYLPVLDDRVKLTMIAGAFSTYRDSYYAMPHCLCQCLPNMMRYGEMSDVVALHAPRPVLLINGIQDKIFPIDAAREGYQKLQEVYKVLDAEENIDADFFQGGHRWSNNKSLEFLAKHFGE